MNTVRAQMTAEDVARWRANQSQIKALGVKPDWYTRDEAARLLRVETDEARRLLDELGPSGLGLLERRRGQPRQGRGGGLQRL